MGRLARMALAAAVAAGAAAWGACPGGFAGEEGAAAPAKAVIDDLAWLAGSWADIEEGSSFEETWLPPAGGTMTAVSREVAQGATKMFELSSIEPDAEGALWLRVRHFSAGLAPWKSELPETSKWRLASAGRKEVVFEDPAKEFPRSISYRLVGDDALEAALDGTRGGKPSAMKFTLRRVK